MEIKAEWTVAGRDAVHERGGAFRIERAWGIIASRPDRVCGKHVREILGRYQRTADIFIAVTGEGAEERIQSVDAFGSGCESEVAYGLVQTQSGCFHGLSVFVHQHDDAGVIAGSNSTAFDPCNGVFRVFRHVDGILIQSGIGLFKEIIDQTSLLLLPFSEKNVHVRSGCGRVKEDKAVRPAVLHIEVRQQ